MALPLLAYLVLKAVILGSLAEAMLHFLQQKKLLCHEFFTPLTIGRIYPESLLLPVATIPSSGWESWGPSGSGRKRPPVARGPALWIWNFILWSLVYLTAVFWHRFALPALFLAAPLAADFLLPAARPPHRPFAPPAPRWLAAGIIAGLFWSCFIPWSGLDYLQPGRHCRGTSPRTAWCSIFRPMCPAPGLIETPEYELAFLDDDHRIHLMPSYFFVESTPDQVVLLNPRPQPLRIQPGGGRCPDSGDVSAKASFKQIYPPGLMDRDWRRIAQVDYYDIYVEPGLPNRR